MRINGVDTEKRPDREFDASGTTRASHPQESWEWPIAVYLFLAGMGAGAFAVGVLAKWLLHPLLPSKGLLLWGPVLVALGAPFLVLDLGKKTRFINASLNPATSWASRGFVILSSLILTGMGAFALATLPDVLPHFGMTPPAWLANQRGISNVLEAIGLALSLGTAAYTGVFLKSVKAVSLWNTWLLPVLFLFSALSTGAMALIVSLAGFSVLAGNESSATLARTLIPVAMILVALEGGALAWLFTSLRSARRTDVHTIRHLAVKSVPGLVVSLLLLGAVLVVASTGAGPVFFVVVVMATAAVLGGGFLLRKDVVKAGTKDEHPLHKMVAMKYDWAVREAYAEIGGRPESKAAPVEMRPIAAPRMVLRPVLQLALSTFAWSSGNIERTRLRILAVLYWSVRHPVKVSVQYLSDSDGA
jgi:polysulfide reductase chain C